MKLRSPLLTTLLLLSALGFLVFLKKQSSTNQASAPGLFRKAMEFQGRPAQAAILPSTEKTAPPAAALPAADCTRFHEEIETLPLESLLSDLKDRKLLIPQNCQADDATRALFEALARACSADQIQSEKNECETHLFQYRARRIELWSQGQDLKSLATDVLIQKFFGILAAGEFSQKNGNQEIRNIAEELKTRLPDSAAPYRLEVVSYLTAEKLTPEESETYEQALQEARRRDPNDWQLYEIELLKDAKEDPFLYEEKIHHLLASDPNSPIGLYHAGCISWKNGDHAVAMAYFEKASAQSPQDRRMSDTYQKAQSENPEASICAASISFNPDSF